MDFVLKDLALRNRVPFVRKFTLNVGMNFVIGPPSSGKSTLIDVVFNNSFHDYYMKISASPVIKQSCILKVDFKTMKSNDERLNVLFESVFITTGSIDCELKVIQIVAAYLSEGAEFSLVLFDNISYYLMFEQQAVVLSLLVKMPSNVSLVVTSLADINYENCNKINLECF